MEELVFNLFPMRFVTQDLANELTRTRTEWARGRACLAAIPGMISVRPTRTHGRNHPQAQASRQA